MTSTVVESDLAEMEKKLYHHFIEKNELELPTRIEEKQANAYARDLLKTK
jgi:hypothetical protein